MFDWIRFWDVFMQVDQRRLRQRVLKYLKSSEAEPLFREFDVSWIVRIFGTMVVVMIGVIQILRITKARDGMKILMHVLALKTFENPGRTIRKHPERLVPLIGAGIVIGPQGHGLVLGTFDASTQGELEFLMRKAEEFGTLYVEGTDVPRLKSFVELLRQHTYVPGRRRDVPKPIAEGRPLTLLDLEVNETTSFRAPSGGLLIPCVASPGDDDKTQVQIPWHVVADTVSL